MMHYLTTPIMFLFGYLSSNTPGFSGDGGLITVPAHNRVGFTAGAELNKSAQ